MRQDRPRFTVRRMMITVALAGLVLSYYIRLFVCNSIRNRHVEEFLSLRTTFPPGLSAEQVQMSDYYRENVERYGKATVFPWVRVPLRFVTFDEYRRSKSTR
jgi:hypothetical protein